MRLLSAGHTNAKQRKGLDADLDPWILYLRSSPRVCPWAVRNGCLTPCLEHQGRGKMLSVQEARQRKTGWFFDDRPGFMAALHEDLRAVVKRTKGTGKLGVVRLDGTSDLGLALKLHQEYPSLMFYDYTKSLNRVMRWRDLVDRGFGQNYHLTFSLGSSNESDAFDALGMWTNVAVAFKGELPRTYRIGDWDWNVIDGDKHDWRWRDPSPCIVGLRAKGNSAKLDTEGFMR